MIVEERTDQTLTDYERELFYRKADSVSRMTYRGYPIHVWFTCPICSGTAEVIRRSPQHGIARCMNCGIVLARGKIQK